MYPLVGSARSWRLVGATPPGSGTGGEKGAHGLVEICGLITDRQETSVLSSGAGMPISVPSAGKGHTLQQNAQDSQVV